MGADDDKSIQKRFQELRADLNMDKQASDEAWDSYQRISTNYTLEGDQLHWLACALYVACRAGAVPTVDKGSYIEGNCVSLTRLLRSCKLSLVQFFSKMKKWADMANLSQDMRNKVDRLERNFNVSTVIFKKFKPIFVDIFKDPLSDPPRQVRSRKQRRLPCTASDVFSFCWTLFIRVKGHYPAISDDLVNSYHLLLSCIDLLYGNAVMADRKDLLNPNFSGFSSIKKTPTELPCIIQHLCETHEGLVVEAKGIKEHWWKPHISRMMTKKILKGKPETLSGLLDVNNFKDNDKAINAEYEEYVLNVGDFDERVFLVENASEEIGTPSVKSIAGKELIERMQTKKNLQKHLEETTTLAPATPLTGRRYLKDKESVNVTPVSTATQSVSRLHTLLAGYKTSPSEKLLDIFSECSRNPESAIMKRVKEMGEIFCVCYAQPTEDHPGSHIDFAKKRLQLGESLYFKVLENIILMERKRFHPLTDLSELLERDIFHRTLFACCLEIVLFSYNSQRTFPWILQSFEIQPYCFYKVIELLIRAEEGLSRDVVKHLNHIEEQILESLAWKYDSNLWNAIRSVGLPIPSCEDVSLPSQMSGSQTTGPPPQLVSSPLAHPAVRRISGIERPIARKDPQSPIGTTVAECFQSPTAGTPPSSARRRLFGPTQSNTVAVAVPQTPAQNTVGDQLPTVTPATSAVMSPGRSYSITLQPIQSDNGITYISIPTFTLSTTQIPVPATTTATGIPTPVATPETTTVNASVINTATIVNKSTNKPKRAGSLGLFFRKVYHLAGVRLRDLCDRLNILDEDLRRKIWTCFEYSLMQYTELMCDRHLDQLIMCAIYVICKVTREDKSFQEIMKCYRLQPQAASHVYRSVLMSSKKRRNSGSSDNSKNGSGSNSPVPTEREEKETGRTERLSTIRSSSTLPVPHPSSQPPTPTRLTGTGTHFEFEDRGDLIMFYNTVYVPKLQSFALKFTQGNNCERESPPLSPLPRLNANPLSPWRRVSSKHSVYVSPLKNSNFPPSPSRPLSYSFNRSYPKDLRAINCMMKRKVGKRILQDDSEPDSPAKRISTDLTLRKIQNVITERQGGGTE